MKRKEYTYHHDLRSRIPCYRLVRPQQHQDAQKQSKLRATAREFSPPVRQETERAQDREEEQEEPEFVIEGPDPGEEMDDGSVGERGELRRSQRRGRPAERFTYDTLGHPSYRSWSADANTLLSNQPLAMTPTLVPFPCPIHPHQHYYSYCTLTH